MKPRSLLRWSVGQAVGATAFATVAHAQLRNLPVFFESSYAYHTRVGVDVGHGGEANGSAIVVGASRLFYVGNCARLSLSGAVGTWNAPRGDFETHLNAGGAASFLVNPCPRPTTVHGIPIRLLGGVGVTVVDDREIVNIPVGVGVGFRHPGLPVGRLEPWVIPRVHYREYPTGDAEWDFAFSIGANVGVGGVAGARLAIDCCEGGVGGGYGLSLWF